MATASQELDAFVHESLLRGIPRGDIEQALVQAGWPREQGVSALAAYADVAFPVPIPRPRASLSAREAFLYLVLFSTLYLSAYHLGSLLFDLINRAVPDAASSTYPRSYLFDSMRWSVASLLIAFPVFLYTARYIGRDLVQHPTKRLSPVRRWLTYLTLFIASGCLIGDLTDLLYNFLGGALTTRFVLKVIVVGVIAGAIFGYYLSDLRREERET